MIRQSTVQQWIVITAAKFANFDPIIRIPLVVWMVYQEAWLELGLGLALIMFFQGRLYEAILGILTSPGRLLELLGGKFYKYKYTKFISFIVLFCGSMLSVLGFSAFYLAIYYLISNYIATHKSVMHLLFSYSMTSQLMHSQLMRLNNIKRLAINVQQWWLLTFFGNIGFIVMLTFSITLKYELQLLFVAFGAIMSIGFWFYFHYAVVNITQKKKKPIFEKLNKSSIRTPDSHLINVPCNKVLATTVRNSEKYFYLRRLAEHLYDEGDFNRLKQLVISREWMDMQLRSDAMAQQYLQSIDLALNLHEKQDGKMYAIPGLMFLRASIGSSWSEMPPSLAILVARIGRTSQAINFAQSIYDPVLRCQALCGIIKVNSKMGDFDSSNDALKLVADDLELIAKTSEPSMKLIALGYAVLEADLPENLFNWCYSPFNKIITGDVSEIDNLTVQVNKLCLLARAKYHYSTDKNYLELLDKAGNIISGYNCNKAYPNYNELWLYQQGQLNNQLQTKAIELIVSIANTRFDIGDVNGARQTLDSVEHRLKLIKNDVEYDDEIHNTISMGRCRQDDLETRITYFCSILSDNGIDQLHRDYKELITRYSLDECSQILLPRLKEFLNEIIEDEKNQIESLEFDDSCNYEGLLAGRFNSIKGQIIKELKPTSSLEPYLEAAFRFGLKGDITALKEIAREVYRKDGVSSKLILKIVGLNGAQKLYLLLVGLYGASITRVHFLPVVNLIMKDKNIGWILRSFLFSWGVVFLRLMRFSIATENKPPRLNSLFLIGLRLLSKTSTDDFFKMHWFLAEFYLCCGQVKKSLMWVHRIKNTINQEKVWKSLVRASVNNFTLNIALQLCEAVTDPRLRLEMLGILAEELELTLSKTPGALSDEDKQLFLKQLMHIGIITYKFDSTHTEKFVLSRYFCQFAQFVSLHEALEMIKQCEIDVNVFALSITQLGGIAFDKNDVKFAEKLLFEFHLNQLEFSFEKTISIEFYIQMLSALAENWVIKIDQCSNHKKAKKWLKMVRKVCEEVDLRLFNHNGELINTGWCVFPRLAIEVRLNRLKKEHPRWIYFLLYDHKLVANQIFKGYEQIGIKQKISQLKKNPEFDDDESWKSTKQKPLPFSSTEDQEVLRLMAILQTEISPLDDILRLESLRWWDIESLNSSVSMIDDNAYKAYATARIAESILSRQKKSQSPDDKTNQSIQNIANQILQEAIQYAKDYFKSYNVTENPTESLNMSTQQISPISSLACVLVRLKKEEDLMWLLQQAKKYAFFPETVGLAVKEFVSVGTLSKANKLISLLDNDNQRTYSIVVLANVLAKNDLHQAEELINKSVNSIFDCWNVNLALVELAKALMNFPPAFRHSVVLSILHNAIQRGRQTTGLALELLAHPIASLMEKEEIRSSLELNLKVNNILSFYTFSEANTSESSQYLDTVNYVR